VISYELYCQIQLYYKERGLSFAQIGRELNLDRRDGSKVGAPEDLLPAPQSPAKEQA